MIAYPPRVWAWLLLAGCVQPAAMEAYNWADWYWADPLLVRFVTLLGPAFLCLVLATTPVVCARFELREWRKTHHGDPEHVRKIAEKDAEALESQYTTVMLVALMLLVLPSLFIRYNYVYRPAFLALQLLLVAMWWLAIKRERRAWRAEVWARWLGFGMACLGLVACILFQFILAETPFLGTMPEYDPSTETASAMVVATGLPVSVWVLPGVSMLAVAGFVAYEQLRLYRRRSTC